MIGRYTFALLFLFLGCSKGEAPQQALDYNADTKFLCFSRTLQLDATFSSPVAHIDGYDLVTANGACGTC